MSGEVAPSNEQHLARTCCSEAARKARAPRILWCVEHGALAFYVDHESGEFRCPQGWDRSCRAVPALVIVLDED